MDTQQNQNDRHEKELLAEGLVTKAFLCMIGTDTESEHIVSKRQMVRFAASVVGYYPVFPTVALELRGALDENPDTVAAVFTCRMCQKIFEDPVTLSCPRYGHTFCKSCISGATGSFHCRICESPFSLSSLSSMNVSYTVQRLIENLFPKQVELYGIKKEGNQLFHSKDYLGATKKYTQALDKGGKDVILFSNRSHAYHMLGENEKAAEDATQAISARPSWPKAYYRKALALSNTDDLSGALVATLQMMLLDRDLVQTRTILPDLLWRFLATENSGSVQSNHQTAGQESDQGLEDDVMHLTQADARKFLEKLEECFLQAKRGLEGDTSRKRALDRSEPIPQDDPVKCQKTTEETDMLPNLSVITEGMNQTDVSPETLEELLTCTLCYRLLYQPVTPSCGHSFCQQCLHRVLDFKPSCPQCRQDLSDFLATRQFSTSEVLEKAMTLLLNKACQERVAVYREEMRRLSITGEGETEVAIFVLTDAWPGVLFPLHVFEPRYRLMIRQAVESGSNMFGMCSTTAENGAFGNVGTMLKIEDVEYFDDGRCFVSTKGYRRFKVLSRGMRDGYNTARVEYIKDDPIPNDSLSAVTQQQDEIYAQIEQWMSSLEGNLITQITGNYGPLPPKHDLSVYSYDGPVWIWWLAAVTDGMTSTSATRLLESVDVSYRITEFSRAWPSFIASHAFTSTFF